MLAGTAPCPAPRDGDRAPSTVTQNRPCNPVAHRPASGAEPALVLGGVHNPFPSLLPPCGTSTVSRAAEIPSLRSPRETLPLSLVTSVPETQAAAPKASTGELPVPNPHSTRWGWIQPRSLQPLKASTKSFRSPQNI